MAERRMFSRRVIDNDSFIDMPATARLLYYDLGMRADDEGFVDNPKSIARLTGASKDDLNVLASKGFIMLFKSGVIVLRHWRLNNYIRPDRLTESIYKRERGELTEDENGIYTLLPNAEEYITGNCQSNDVQVTGKRLTYDGQVTDTRPSSGSIDKNRIGKGSAVEDRTDDCTEPEAVAVLSIPLNDKTEYPVTQSDIDKWQELYPAVDVLQQLRAMRGWCDANPSRRKTKTGIRRFINSWLSREQDRGGMAKAQSSNGSTAQKLDDFYDMAAEWAASEEVKA